MGRSSFKIVFTIFFWICLIVSFLYILNDLPSIEQWAQLLSLDKVPGIIFLALSVVLAMVLRGIRWGVLLKSDYFRSWGELIAVFGWCFLLMAFSPFRSGEISRVLWVRRKGGSGTYSVGVIMAERLTDLFVLLANLGIVIIFYPAFSSSLSSLGLLWLVGITFIYIVVSALSIPAQRYFSNRLVEQAQIDDGESLKSKFYAKTNLLLQGVTCLGELKINLKVLFLTIIIWGLMAFGFYWYLNSFFTDIHFLSSVSVLVLVNLAGLIGISPGNIGIYEIAAVMALKPFGIVASDALVAAVGLHFIVLLVAIIYGLFCRIILRGSRQSFWDIV